MRVLEFGDQLRDRPDFLFWALEITAELFGNR
jgi:hypothetical protein